MNYIEFLNPGREELNDFLVELLATLIRKGPVPEPLRVGLDDRALESSVPEELAALTQSDPERLKAYPFEPDAFAEFVEQTAVGDMSGKPSELLKRLQKAARRAMTSDVRLIDSKIVDAIGSEGF
ncbi:MAG: hypothetical protein IPH55_06630 [Betaproteobacteria bacterium]|nr:hypothetical protein [Betaproteobacteria bacterium]